MKPKDAYEWLGDTDFEEGGSTVFKGAILAFCQPLST
jgi:hypothetical protein